MTPIQRTRLMSGWLGQVSPSLADAILDAGQILRFRDGETIYGFGQPQDCLYGIANGVIQMWVTMNEQDPRFGHVAVPGFWFGETEVVTGKAGIVEMVATGEAELLSLSRKSIDKIAVLHHDMWPALTLLAVLNQGLAIGAADDLMIRDSRQKTAALLLRLCSRRNAYQAVPPLDAIPISWNELSEAAGLSRSKIGAILTEFTKSGFVRTKRRRIEILDPNGLENLLKD